MDVCVYTHMKVVLFHNPKISNGFMVRSFVMEHILDSQVLQVGACASNIGPCHKSRSINKIFFKSKVIH
jgi:hypothetical protein